jgi:hypothetical protein
MYSDGPDVLRLQRRLLAHQLAFVPGFPVLRRLHGRLYGRLPFAKGDLDVLGQIGCSSISGLFVQGIPAGPDGIR